MQFFISCPIGHSEAIETEAHKKWGRRKKILVFLGVIFAVAGLLLLSRDILSDLHQVVLNSSSI